MRMSVTLPIAAVLAIAAIGSSTEASARGKGMSGARSSSPVRMAPVRATRAAPTRVVRDHRATPTVRDHRVAPTRVVRDHRTPAPAATPAVRDHRATPTVRDHRTPAAAPTVRDHRATPTVRDHRAQGGVRVTSWPTPRKPKQPPYKPTLSPLPNGGR